MLKRKTLGRHFYMPDKSNIFLPAMLISCYLLGILFASLFYAKKWLLPDAFFASAAGEMKNFFSLGITSQLFQITAAAWGFLLVLALSGVGAGGVITIPILFLVYGALSGTIITFLFTEGREVLLSSIVFLPALALFGAAFYFCGKQAFFISMDVFLLFQQKASTGKYDFPKYAMSILLTAIGSLILAAATSIWIAFTRLFA